MPRNHLVITGTGRAGTTFLVQLLTRLGLETGYPDPNSGIFENCNAGMEWDLRAPDAPYVVKSPWLCDTLDEILSSGEVVIDHALVPVRDLYEAAESRRDVMRRSPPEAAHSGIMPGGLWLVDRPEDQEAALACQLYRLIRAVARHEVPLTLLDFPRIVHDPEYLFRRLSPALGGIDEEAFRLAFDAVSRPDQVHRFEPRPQGSGHRAHPPEAGDPQAHRPIADSA